MTFQIKRVYDPVAADDGQRVLVDRLWPRGLRKTDAHLDLWMKEIAPSTALRSWFDHDPDKFAEFSTRYRKELAGLEALGALRQLGKKGKITLLYAAHDPKVNHATVLLSVLKGRVKPAAVKRG
jgi:uncharacterized protein YeaO (DUF488 family)